MEAVQGLGLSYESWQFWPQRALLCLVSIRYYIGVVRFNVSHSPLRHDRLFSTCSRIILRGVPGVEHPLKKASARTSASIASARKEGIAHMRA